MALPAPSENAVRRVEWAAVVLAVSPLLLSLADDIQLIDPAQYAEVARRIVATGQLAHLHDNNGPFTDKPPITFWLIAASLKALGMTPLAVRLPSLLMGLVLLAFVYGIGKELWDAATGRRAALLLGASLAFQLMVLDPKIDMVLTAFIAGALYFAILGRRRPGALLLAWLCAALGLLTKGPIGLVAPVLALAPEGLRHRWGDASDDRGWLDRVLRFRPLAGLLILAALVGPWLVESHAEFGAYGPLFLLWKQSFGRLFERTYRNDTTPLFFLHTALWAFLPFTLILVDALARRAAAWKRAAWALPTDETRVVLWWLVLPFIGISASSYKLPQYLFWLSPPAALLAAQALRRLDLAEAARAARGWCLAHRVLAGLSVILVAALTRLTFPVPAMESAAWCAAALTPILLAMVASPWIPRSSAVVLHVAAATLGFQLYLSGSFHRRLLAYQPDRAFGLAAREVDPDGVVLPCLDTPATSSEAFAAQRPAVAVDVQGLAELARTDRARVAIAAASALHRVEAAGLHATPLLEGDSYPTSRLTGHFLDARTRPATLTPLVLVRLDR